MCIRDSPKGVVGWRMSHFLSLDDALMHYASLPATGVKSIGLTDGVHCLEIARCVPLFEYDREGEDLSLIHIYNGMQLSQLYDGKNLPCYHHENDCISVGLTSRLEPSCLLYTSRCV